MRLSQGASAALIIAIVCASGAASARFNDEWPTFTPIDRTKLALNRVSSIASDLNIHITDLRTAISRVRALGSLSGVMISPSSAKEVNEAARAIRAVTKDLTREYMVFETEAFWGDVKLGPAILDQLKEYRLPTLAIQSDLGAVAKAREWVLRPSARAIANATKAQNQLDALITLIEKRNSDLRAK